MAKTRFTISLDTEIYKILKEQTERDHRTLGEQIAYLLELYVPAYQKIMDERYANAVAETKAKIKNINIIG